MASSMHAFFGACVLAVALAHALEAKKGVLPFQIQTCTSSGCSPEDAYITLDANWRWFRTTGDAKTCFTKGDFTSAADDTCEVEEDDKIYAKAKVKVSGSNLSLGYSEDSGSRVYILDKSGEAYKLFKMVGKEISFDADMSELPCGSNGAVYFVEMQAKPGGQGASAGIGYCDAQCPQDLHQLPNAKINTAYSRLCCNEMDLWEANGQAEALTAHPCSVKGEDMEGAYIPCSGKDCEMGNYCDSDGCDINPYRADEKDFYGNGSSYKLNSQKTFTLTTQFIADDSGKLKEIRRFFIQDGKKVEWPTLKVGDWSGTAITDDYCVAENAAYKGKGGWEKHGGMAMMGRSLERGGVLALSIWNDPLTKMKWLDGTWTDGTDRGPCGSKDDATGGTFGLKYSNIRLGDIDTTTSFASPSPNPTPKTSGNDLGGCYLKPCACPGKSGQPGFCKTGGKIKLDYCAKKSTCGECGGAWCPPPKPPPAAGCYLKPCACPGKSGQPDFCKAGGMIKLDYCGKEGTCGDCGGVWCGGGAADGGMSLGSSEGGSSSEGYSYAYDYEYDYYDNSDYGYEDGSALIQGGGKTYSEVTAHGDIITSTSGDDTHFLREHRVH